MQHTISELAAQVDEILSSNPGDPRAFRSCEFVFKQVLSEGLHIAALNALLRQNLSSKKEITPDISSGQFLVIASSSVSTWAIIRHSGASRWLYMTPNHTMSAKLAGGPLSVSRYLLPDIEDPSVLDKSMALTATDSTEVSPGEVFSKNGDTTVIDVRSETSRPAFTLRLNTIPHGDYEWAFDRSSLMPIRISGVRQFESNITTIFDLLQAARVSSSVEHVLPFVDHRMHFIRWKAIQTIGAIDPIAGLAQVEKATADSHPEVRAAARRTLEAYI